MKERKRGSSKDVVRKKGENIFRVPTFMSSFTFVPTFLSSYFGLKILKIMFNLVHNVISLMKSAYMAHSAYVTNKIIIKNVTLVSTSAHKHKNTRTQT